MHADNKGARSGWRRNLGIFGAAPRLLFAAVRAASFDPLALRRISEESPDMEMEEAAATKVDFSRVRALDDLPAEDN